MEVRTPQGLQCFEGSSPLPSEGQLGMCKNVKQVLLLLFRHHSRNESNIAQS